MSETFTKFTIFCNNCASDNVEIINDTAFIDRVNGLPRAVQVKKLKCQDCKHEEII
jgi:Zn finger protein HypA/HybF involved in hydrogenase expression